MESRLFQIKKGISLYLNMKALTFLKTLRQNFISLKIMESLSNIIDEEVRLKEYLVRIGDLINIEGPLLSLFSDVRNENLYLYDWVDTDEISNRFVIYNIPPQVILDYLSKKITHQELFSHATDEQYLVADIRPSELSGYKIFWVKQLPEDYRDVEANFFDEQFCKDVEKIILFVTRVNMKNSNDFTAFTIGHDFGQEIEPWEIFEQQPWHDIRHFHNWVDYPITETILDAVSSSQTVQSPFAERKKFNDHNLEVFCHVRKDNRIPEEKRLELYREQRTRFPLS